MNKVFLTILNNVINENYQNIDKEVTLLLSSQFEFKEFQKIYIKFENDNFNKLKKYLLQDKNLDTKLSKMLETSLKQTKKNYNVVTETLPLEIFVVPGGKSETIMNQIRFIYELMDEDFSVLSLLGNDSYTDKSSLAHKLLSFNIKDLPKDFNESLIDTLFDNNGAMEWSIDGHSRIEAIKTILPLYTSPKVLEIYKEVITSSKKEKAISQQVESVINSISEMTVHPEKIFKTKEQQYMLDVLANIINIFKIPVKEENLWSVEDFNYTRPALEMNLPIPSAQTREKIQKNIDEFKINIVNQLVIKKPKPKI